jgi:hypothetical protein
MKSSATGVTGRRLSLHAKNVRPWRSKRKTHPSATAVLTVGNKQYTVFLGRKRPPGCIRLTPPSYLSDRDPSLKDPIWIPEDQASEANEAILPNVWVGCEKTAH